MCRALCTKDCITCSSKHTEILPRALYPSCCATHILEQGLDTAPCVHLQGRKQLGSKPFVLRRSYLHRNTTFCKVKHNGELLLPAHRDGEACTYIDFRLTELTGNSPTSADLKQPALAREPALLTSTQSKGLRAIKPQHDPCSASGTARLAPFTSGWTSLHSSVSLRSLPAYSISSSIFNYLQGKGFHICLLYSIICLSIWGKSSMIFYCHASPPHVFNFHIHSLQQNNCATAKLRLF